MGDSSYVYNGLILSYTDGKLGIKEKLPKALPLEKIKGNISTKIPIIPILNYEQVISKIKTNGQVQFLNQEDTFLTQEDSYKSSSFLISGVRKESANEIFDYLNKYQIVDIAIGKGDLLFLKEQDIINDNSILVNNESFSFSENSFKIDELDTLEYYTIGEEKISSEYILCFAKATSYFLEHKTIFNHPIVKLGHENFVYRFWSNLVLKIALPLFVLGFVISLFYLKKYTDLRNNQLVDIELHKSQTNKLKKLEDEFTKKIQITEAFGVSVNSKYAKILDQIGNTIPQNIVLNNLSFFPIKQQTLANNEKIVIEKGIIRIKGHSNSINTVNNWTSSLRKLMTLNKVKILYFDNKKEDSNFSLEIEVK